MNEWKLPLTIERQLEEYAQMENHSQRHEILWHTWNQNKRWIVQLLDGISISFPTYSKHDESHAETVLHNIELILGEDRIRKLSATDCFLILHTVYIHDIGMTITAAERKEIINDPKFMKMVDWLESEGDISLRKAVNALKRNDYSSTETDIYKKNQQLYQAKLEIYDAIINLIGNYRRGEHGKKSSDRLYEWTLDENKLGSGFSLAGMPQRIFLTIADCARMHTEAEFDEILSLSQEDNGYVSDYIHPRFVSLLLQLGDILDMDNDRFHPLAMSSLDEISEMSKFHYKKHMSIRRLHIRPDQIEIVADCDSQEALRLVRKECDMLISILQKAGYKWPMICPAGFPGALPMVKNVSLYLQGHPIPQELVTMRFEIAQQKAFEIIEGSNLYENRFAFLREFLQNALDATKLQYWQEYLNMSGDYSCEKCNFDTLPTVLNNFISTKKFPIQIEMKICKKTIDDKISLLEYEDIINLKAGKTSDVTWGVLVSIKDYGTGISSKDLKRISSVGTEIDKNSDLIRKMPEWLKPTAEFGIGMQSAFMVTNSFRCFTHTRSNECYEITFNSGASTQYEGYINVKPFDRFCGRKQTYGSLFEIFVPESKKLLHEEFRASWDGSDMFSEEYETLRPIRHATELISQMTLYLDNLVGKTGIFPIQLKIYNFQNINIPLGTNVKNKIKSIDLEIVNIKPEGGSMNGQTMDKR